MPHPSLPKLPAAAPPFPGAGQVRSMQLVQHPSVLRLHAVEEVVDYPRVRGKGTRSCTMLVLELSQGNFIFFKGLNAACSPRAGSLGACACCTAPLPAACLS